MDFLPFQDNIYSAQSLEYDNYPVNRALNHHSSPETVETRYFTFSYLFLDLTNIKLFYYIIHGSDVISLQSEINILSSPSPAWFVSTHKEQQKNESRGLYNG